MANTFTTNYSLTKSEVGANNDNWGTDLNNALSSVDGQIVRKVDKTDVVTQTSNKIAFSGNTITGNSSTASTIFQNFQAGDIISIAGSSNSGNNGNHTINSKTNAYTLVTGTSFTTESEATNTISYHLVPKYSEVDIDGGTINGATFTGGTINNDVTGNLTGNADTVSNGIYTTNTDATINGHKIFIGGSSSTPSLTARYQNAESFHIRKDYDNSNNHAVKLYEQDIEGGGSSFGRIEIMSQTSANGYKSQIILGQIIGGGTADGYITVYNQANTAYANIAHTGITTSSDERTKTNIEELAPQLNENTPAIKKYDQYDKKRVGVVAQDIEKIRADWVESTIQVKDTTKELEGGFEDQRFVNNEMILFNYIAELTKEVLALKSELAELKNK